MEHFNPNNIFNKQEYERCNTSPDVFIDILNRMKLISNNKNYVEILLDPTYHSLLDEYMEKFGRLTTQQKQCIIKFDCEIFKQLNFIYDMSDDDFNLYFGTILDIVDRHGKTIKRLYEQIFDLGVEQIKNCGKDPVRLIKFKQLIEKLAQSISPKKCVLRQIRRRNKCPACLCDIVEGFSLDCDKINQLYKISDTEFDNMMNIANVYVGSMTTFYNYVSNYAIDQAKVCGKNIDRIIMVKKILEKAMQSIAPQECELIQAEQESGKCPVCSCKKKEGFHQDGDNTMYIVIVLIIALLIYWLYAKC